MTQFEEEKLARIYELLEKLDHIYIKAGVYIGEVFTPFEERKFFDNRMSMWVPANFTEMEHNFAKKKYTSEQRPQLILTNPEGDVNITLNLFEQKIGANQVGQAIEGYRVLLHKAYPANVFYNCEVEPLGETNLGWIDYKSYALDGQLYNLMFVTGIGQKVMLGTFNCVFEDYGNWRAYMLQMIRLIVDIPVKKDEFKKIKWN